MIHSKLRRVLILSLCLLLISAAVKAQAHPQAIGDTLGGKTKTALIIAVLVGVTAAIGVGVYFAIRQGHTVKGCVAAGPSGLELQTRDSQSLLLLGATQGIKAGDRIKARGARKKSLSGITDRPSFVVETLDKVYGACTVAAAHP